MSAAHEDLITELRIDNLMQSQVGRVLDALREAGYEIEINLAAPAAAKETPS